MALVAYLLPVLSSLAPCPLWAQQGTIVFHFHSVAREIVAQRLQRLHSTNADREADLRAMFREAGCPADHLQEEIVRRNDPPNVLCTLAGLTTSLIIVGAHFDHAERGAGAVDDWSGASLLPSLYQALREWPRQHTFIFVGFTDEEKGLVGSYSYVRQFSKDQLSTIQAMANLECLGLGPTEVWADAANKRLLGALVKVAHHMHVGLSGVNVERVGNDDTQAFRDKKLPVITIHSLTQETLPILHSPRDTLGAIRLNDLYESYSLLSEYLAFIDQALD
jgi:peptidase M28-like protein